MAYPETIRKLNNKMILSQMEFAKLLGVFFPSVYRCETCRYEPTKKEMD